MRVSKTSIILFSTENVFLISGDKFSNIDPYPKRLLFSLKAVIPNFPNNPDSLNVDDFPYYN